MLDLYSICGVRQRAIGCCCCQCRSHRSDWCCLFRVQVQTQTPARRIFVSHPLLRSLRSQRLSYLTRRHAALKRVGCRACERGKALRKGSLYAPVFLSACAVSRSFFTRFTVPRSENRYGDCYYDLRAYTAPAIRSHAGGNTLLAQAQRTLESNP